MITINFLIYLLFTIVPTPIVTVDVPTMQIVGQSLTLQYTVTMVRGITNRVVIMWRREGRRFYTTHVTDTTTMGTLVVYRGFYTILQLSTSDDGIMYEYRLVVRGNSRVKTNGTIRLNVTGKYSRLCHILHDKLYQCRLCISNKNSILSATKRARATCRYLVKLEFT